MAQEEIRRVFSYLQYFLGQIFIQLEIDILQNCIKIKSRFFKVSVPSFCSLELSWIFYQNLIIQSESEIIRLALLPTPKIGSFCFLINP